MCTVVVQYKRTFSYDHKLPLVVVHCKRWRYGDHEAAHVAVPMSIRQALVYIVWMFVLYELLSPVSGSTHGRRSMDRMLQTR